MRLAEDRVVGPILLAFAVAIGVEAVRLRLFVGPAPGPGFVPLLISAGLIVLAALMTARGFRAARLATVAAQTQDAGSPSSVERVEWPRGQALRRTLILTGIVVAYIALLQFVGFLPATVLATFALVRLLSGWRIIATVAVGVVVPLATYALFVLALGVRLP